MSEYLTNLVERTVSPELVVRPKFVSPFEQMPVVEIALEQSDERLEQHFEEESRVVDLTERDETSVIPPEFEPEVRREEAPPKSQIEFEVVKPHPTVRNDDDEFHEARPIEVSAQAIVQEQKTSITESNISKPLSLGPRTVLKLERQSTRTSRISESFRNVNDEGRGDHSEDSRLATPSSVTIRIGRVEVRAMVTAPSRGVERRASKSLRPSLDEYLERRSKGGRS